MSLIGCSATPFGCGVVLESTQARSFSLTWNACRLRRRPPGLALGDRGLQRLAAELRGEVDAALAVLRLERVEPDDRGDAVADLLERAGARPAAIGMHHEADVLQVLPFEQVDDVGDVGVEDRILAQQVRAVAEAGQRRREDLVAWPRADRRRAASTSRRARRREENEGLARLRYRRRCAERRRADAGGRGGEHGAAGHRMVVGHGRSS